MKDTPPWWWKLGWTLAEATPKPQPLTYPGSVAGSLREKTAARAAELVAAEPRKSGCGKNGALPVTKGFLPSKKKKGGW